LTSRNGTGAVLFDLDGTLCSNRPSFNDAYQDYARQLGQMNESDSRRLAIRWLHYYWAQSPELLSDLQTFVGDDDLFWTNHARLYLLQLGSSEEQAAALASQLFQQMRDGYRPQGYLLEEVPQVLKALKGEGLRLGVVSNRTQPYDEELDTFGIRSYFEFALAAGALESWKPDPVIFQHALKLLGVKPGETIYVGDNYYADVIGARNAGLRPILLDPEGIFPVADCPVIRNLGELKGMVQ
jgi:HAD superfamily hydrolase (TIGR01549 family)